MHSGCVILGQTILRYKVPYNIFNAINGIYEKNFNSLNKVNDFLAGKIEKEHSLYYDGNDITEDKMSPHNLLPKNISNYLLRAFENYMKFILVKNYKLHLDSVWVNEMKENEYNPNHIHRGASFIGLSSVMILKLPSTFGKEYSNSDNPQNGKLQLLGSSSGQFAKVDYQPPTEIGDLYIFPYDMRHCVYPFNGTKEIRRTLAANCDIWHDQILDRGMV